MNANEADIEGLIPRSCAFRWLKILEEESDQRSLQRPKKPDRRSGSYAQHAAVLAHWCMGLGEPETREPCSAAAPSQRESAYPGDLSHSQIRFLRSVHGSVYAVLRLDDTSTWKLSIRTGRSGGCGSATPTSGPFEEDCCVSKVRRPIRRRACSRWTGCR